MKEERSDSEYFFDTEPQNAQISEDNSLDINGSSKFLQRNDSQEQLCEIGHFETFLDMADERIEKKSSRDLDDLDLIEDLGQNLLNVSATISDLL